MNLPPAKEFWEAVGYSLGRARVWLSTLIPIFKRLLGYVIAGLIIYFALPYILDHLAELKAINASVVVGIFALGFMFFGAAAFCYVLFAFLNRLVAVDPSIPRDVAHMVRKLANPPMAVPRPAATGGGGSFNPYDEDKAYLQEQLEELQRNGVLNGIDLEEMMKEGHTADLEFHTPENGRGV